MEVVHRPVPQGYRAGTGLAQSERMTDDEVNEIEVNEILDNVDRMLRNIDKPNGAAMRRQSCARHRGPAVNSARCPARPGERASLRLGSACTLGAVAPMS